MITTKIKALFHFIEYLYSNIDNFNKYNDLINELELLDEKKQKVLKKRTFKEKLRYDEIQTELEEKYKLLQENTANLIKAKARELKVCDFENEPEYNWNNLETNILELKDNFSIEDIPEIFKHKNQYIEYRTKTHRTFLSLSFFFNELDDLLKELFDFFKEGEQNEFEPFETKTIEVKSIQEALELLRPDRMKIKQKIHYYQVTKWNIAFRTLHHSVITVCDFLRPIAPEIDPLRYIEYFLEEIDFDRIEYNEDRTQNLKYCETIFYGLESILRADVGRYILEYQQRISNLSNEEIKAKQRELIPITGNLKLQTKNFKQNINFSQYYLDFREVVKTKPSLTSWDYQSLILTFEEMIAVQLLNSFQIIIDTFSQLEPLSQPTSQQTETTKSDEEYKNTNWFKVGLLFAKGEMNKYFDINTYNQTVIKSKYTAPLIANELGCTSYNKFILASLNNYTDNHNKSKNIFNSRANMMKIIAHCEVNNITVDSYFLSRLPIE